MNFNQNLNLALKILPIELFNTLYMVFVSGLFAFLIGLPLGVTLLITDKGGLKANRWINQPLGLVVNIGRSIPFAILMITVIPFTRLLVGTSIGTTASIIPLTLAAAPFVARVVQAALKGVDLALIEAAQVMGSRTYQIIFKVLLPEALPALIQGITLMSVNLISFSAMAGLVGGGGLGKVAIQYGYQRFNGFLMFVTLLLLLLLVECVQWVGSMLSQAILLRRGK